MNRILRKGTRGLYRTGTTSGTNYMDLSNRLNMTNRIIGKIGERIPPRMSRWHFESEGPEITGISSATLHSGLQK